MRKDWGRGEQNCRGEKNIGKQNEGQQVSSKSLKDNQQFPYNFGSDSSQIIQIPTHIVAKSLSQFLSPIDSG